MKRLLLALALVPLASCGLLQTTQFEGNSSPPVGADAATEPFDGSTPGPDAGVAPLPPGAVRIATFNVHRFFDLVCDTGDCTETSYEELPTPAQFNAKADQLAAAIRTLDATVVLLEEVESQACLDALLTRLKPTFTGGVIGEIGSLASVDVAMLSRLPIVDVKKHRGQRLTRPDGSTTVFAREFLEVHLLDGAQRTIVFAAHFRSKVNDDPGRRLAEAQAAHDIVSAVAGAFPAALVVFGGDLNDTPGSPPLDALEAGGELLRVEKEITPVSNAGTWGNQAYAVPLDHLFQAVKAAGAPIAGTARVVRDSNSGLGGSDHAALVADFRTK